MTQTQNEVAIRNDHSLVLTPADVVAGATEQAKLLMDIVTRTGCYQTIGQKRYLQVEAWETIGAFNRVHASTTEVSPITDDNGSVIGYQAVVHLLQDGLVVGGASMPCFFSENACKGKDGEAKHKAAMSAAQTFATSKAYRMNYSYVSILAGYQPTPAEEMDGIATDDRPANLEHFCQTHDTKFFKRGKMKAYAHSLADNSGWCNEDEQEKLKPVPEPESPKQTQTANRVNGGQIDRDWAVEQIRILGEGDPNWSRDSVLERINQLVGSNVSSVTHGLSLLNSEKAESFVSSIQEALEFHGK